MPVQHHTRDEALDALAMIDARLRGDERALTLLLDTCDQREAASVLSSMFAMFLAGFHPDPAAAVDVLRQMWTRGEGGGG